MQRSTHAAMGAWTLGPARPTLAWGDAFRSIDLVGDLAGRARTHDAPRAGTDAPTPIQAIAAARTWLADPARRQALTPQIVADATESVDIAEVHVRELDLLAGELATDAGRTGKLDLTRLEQLDLMVAQLNDYSERLRAMLDPETIQVEQVERQLRMAIQSAARGGGLPALVAALQR